MAWKISADKTVILVLIGLIIIGTLAGTNTYKQNLNVEKTRVIPSVSIESPNDGDILNDTSVTIDIYYSAGAVGRVTDVWLYIDGVEMQHWTPDLNSGDEYYDWDYTSYSEGKHVIRADVENLDGETATAIINVYVNFNPPYGKITNPLDGEIIGGNSVPFTVSAIDNGSGINSTKWYIDGIYLDKNYTSSWSEGYQSYITFTYTLDTTKYSDGTHTLIAEIYDNGGNIYWTSPDKSYTTSISVIIDNNPPSVSIIQPSPNEFISGSTTINVNAQDSGSGIDHVDFYIDGTKVYSDSSSPYTYDWNTTQYGNGNHQIKVVAEDKAGHSNESTITVYVDNQVPTVEITSPANNAILNKNSVSVEWNGSDANSGIDHYEIKIDSGNWNNVGTSTSYTLTISDGNHAIYVKAVDRAGNYAIDSVDILVDTTAPQLTITSPTNEEVINKTNITVKWEASDSSSGIDHYEIKLDNGEWVSVGIVTSYDIKIGNGEHNIYLKAVDKANNIAIKSTNIIVDTEKPLLSIGYPTYNLLINKSTITVKWDGTDNISGINLYEIKIDNDSWISVGISIEYTITNLQDGAHLIYVKAIDKAGNNVEKSVKIMVDTTSPIVEILSPSNGEKITNKNVNVKWTGKDNLSGIANYEIRIDNGSWIPVGLDTTYSTQLSYGNHIIYVKAIDKAGNSKIEKIKIDISKSSQGNGISGGVSGSSGWLLPLIIGIIIALIIVGVVVMALKRRKTQKTEGESESKKNKEMEKDDENP